MNVIRNLSFEQLLEARFDNVRNEFGGPPPINYRTVYKKKQKLYLIEGSFIIVNYNKWHYQFDLYSSNMKVGSIEYFKNQAPETLRTFEVQKFIDQKYGTFKDYRMSKERFALHIKDLNGRLFEWLLWSVM